MLFKMETKRIACALLSAVMLAGNAMSGMTAYAAGTDTPENPGNSRLTVNKEEGSSGTEGVYVNDTPLRLQVSKIKTAPGDHEGIAPKNTPAAQENTVTYQLSGRIDGSESDIVKNYGSDHVELAYSSAGIYLGYGWKKGTLEYLLNRKAQNLDEDIRILYNEYGVFDGFAYVTKTLKTADDTNRYVAGATMGLFEAVELSYDPSITQDDRYYGEDERFTGVTVVRDEGSNNVVSVYVNKGHAGTRVEYVLQKTDGTKIEIDAYGNVIDKNYHYQDAINDTGDGTWIAKTIQREDTPILFYSLDNLNITSNDTYTNIGAKNDALLNDVFGAERYDKENKLYGFDKDGNVVDITQMDELDFSVYAFEAGTNRPVYEFTGGNFNEIRYRLPEKVIELGEGTVMYHLDADGNRDSLVDPQTGIAYVEETVTPEEGHDGAGTRLYAWPVNISYDGSGAVAGNVKGSMTFQKIMTTRIAAINADTPEEYTTGIYNGTSFIKAQNPVLDQYGHPVYYRMSDKTYTKGQDTWDYDGDEYTGYNYKDSLDTENENAYTVNDHDTLYNGDKDDPFNQSTHYQFSDKQSVTLTVDVTGNYIVNGKTVVPVPVRAGYVFAGWLMEPDQLSGGCTVKAYWRNPNSTGMNDTEREQWYSDRAAAGTARQITVTFDANGGEFKNGSGDIHSTDNILYRRLGDAYLMENVWVTGENTPNDPFDTRKVDTVENTADGKDTISGTPVTGNDVYSGTNAGGQADMLKRVNTGLYIMEEVKNPAGYVRGLPVGVAVKENTKLQYTEMTDKTIKAEFIKVDAPTLYEKNLYINGELQVSDAGTSLKVREPKGAWSFIHVPGATLALKAADDKTKKAFSDWVEVTENNQISKKTENGHYYLEFSTDAPLYLEGIPTGNYKISEVVTPDGYVAMEEQAVTISGTDGVHVFTMADDHTKVEIEKYYNDGTGNKNLPNAYRAGLSFTDEAGNVISTWMTDDISDYTNSIASVKKKNTWERVAGLFSAGDDSKKSFIDLFTNKVNSGDTAFTEISWEVTREAVKASSSTDEKETWIISDGSRIVCENKTAPADASQAFKDAYGIRNQETNSFMYAETMSAVKDAAASKNLSDQVWNVSNGAKMHICVYGDNAQNAGGRQSYIAEFQFNYKDDYTGKYRNTTSYDTVDGRHRFDYLPAGTYLLKETQTPEGFVTAADKVVVVDPNGDVQRFTLENKRKQLVIAKTAKKDDVYYVGTENGSAVESTDETHAAVIAGAKLSLYHSENQITDYLSAFADGKIPAGAALSDDWVSGTDGTYAEADYKAEKIREDQIGDYKPHTVTDVVNGWYYLVETETPSHYKTFTVKELHVTDKTTSDVLTEIQAVNTPIPLEVNVHKQNEAGNPLSGAVFTVKNKTLGGTEVGTVTTDASGSGKLVVTDIGRFITDGKLEPYTFTIQEISAPAGYQVNGEIHEFTPSANYHGIVTIMENTADGAIVDGVLYVTDIPSQITISKSDFEDGRAVPGTRLAVYQAEFKDGTWASTGTQSGGDWTWTVKENELTHAVTGLTAGAVYVMQEEAVPDGYTKADDIFFKVSAAGTSIEKIWYDPEESSFISFKADSTGAVESVTFSTRTVLGTYVTLTNLDDKTTENKGTLKGGVVNLSSKDVQDGARYRMKEFVKYSDGGEDCLGTTTFIAKLYNDWMKIDLGKDLRDLSVEITDKDEKEIVSFKPDGNDYTVNNPLIEEPDQFMVVGSIMQKYGVNHSAVQSGNQIRYKVSYKGAGKEIVILPADGLTYIHTGGAEAASDGSYHFTTTKESGELIFIGKVKEDAAGYINQQISVGDRGYSYLNPIAVNHGDGVFEKSSKLVISNAVAGTHQENENAAFTFKITLTNADGSPLSGAYDYRTKHDSGKLHAYGTEKTFEITVNGNDFITIRDLPYNASYSVVEVVSDDYDFVVTNTDAAGKTSNTAVSNVLFTNTRNETSDRTLFEKNTGYILSEMLNFTDGDSRILTKYGFSFGDKCEIKDIAVLNKQTEVWFSKTDWTDCKEIEGALCVLTDMAGNVINDALGNPVEWVSKKEPTKFKGMLKAGETYRYHEKLAPNGYGFSEDIIFTVSKDGTIDKVIMQDKPTIVSFTKEDFAGTEIPGAQCELKVKGDNGIYTVLDSWTSGTTPHQITGSLTPGKEYRYHEKLAPNGFAYSSDIAFMLDKNGRVVDAHYLDQDGDTILYDKNGHTTDIKVITAGDGSVSYEQDGKPVTVVDENAVDETGKIIAEGVKTQIAVIGNIIRMKDFPFSVTFSKEDFAGNEVPGATCELEKVNPDGNVSKIDKWISSGEPHLMDKALTADTVYRYREELAPEGYGYSETIEFTVNKDGAVVDVHYVNEKNEPILYDKDGYPTTIVINPDGTYTDGSHVITIDENGDAVDETGEVHAEGVQFNIPVVDNALIMKDAPTRMSLVKLDETGNAIAGARFQILGKDGSGIVAVRDTEIKSTEHDGMIKKGEKLLFLSNDSMDGIAITGMLAAGADYIMREVTPPSGYIAAADKTFHIPYKNQKDPVVVTMENKPTKAGFSKEDYAGTEVTGAECELEKVNPDGTATKVDKWTSDGTEHKKEGLLEADSTYRYNEKLAPEGYGYSETIEFTVNKDGAVVDAHYVNEKNEPILYDKDGYPTTIVINPDGTYTDGSHVITIDENGDAVDETGEVHAEGVQSKIPVVDNAIIMKDAPTDVFIQKINMEGTVLSGGKFQIFDKGGNVVKAVQDTRIASMEHEGTILAGEALIFKAAAEGINITGQLKAGTDYVLRELEAPAGHVIGPDETFHVPYINQKEPLKVPMKNTPTKAGFSKEDYSGTEIPGAECELEKVNPDGTATKVDKWISDGTEHKKEGLLETDSTYRYNEKLAPEGYGYSETIEFTVNKDGAVVDAHYVNEKNEPILYDKDGYPTTIVINPDGTYTDGSRVVTIDENGDAVDETGAVHAEGVQSKIPVVDNAIIMKDAPTDVFIQKINMEGTVLSGGKFQIFDKSGTPVTAIKDSSLDSQGEFRFKKGEALIFTAEKTGINITGQLKAGTDYILRELEAPAGYMTAKEAAFHVPYKNQKEPLKVIMKDAPTKAGILKVDKTGNPVAGADLEVRDAQNGDLLDYWTSTPAAHEITGILSTGKDYVLMETKAPGGYYKSAPVKFRLSENSEITEVKMTDEPVIVKLVKVKKGSDERLNGGKFSVIKKSDSTIVIPEFVLDGEYIITGKLQAGETYLFHEVEAPSGYQKAGDVEFTVPLLKADDVIEIIMEDTKSSNGGGGGGDPESPSISFKKYDGITMEALPGAEFTIYDSEGNVYKTVTTGKDGYVKVTFHKNGHYSYKETKAPDGYKLDDTVHEFEVTDSMHMSENIANYEKPPHVTIIKKDSETGDPIKGVKFEIVDESGNIVYAGVTDMYGQVTFAPDQFGSYAVFETDVPGDYEISNGYITFTVGKGGVEGDTTFYNNKKDKPHIPDNPGKKPGIIEASYDNGAEGYGKGWFDRDGKWHPFVNIGKTGDPFPFIPLAAVAVFAAAGLAVIKKKKGEKNEEV